MSAPTYWRAVSAEETEEVSAGLSGFLRKRNRALLSSLLAPYHRPVAWASLLVFVNTLTTLAGPFLVKLAIDSGIGDIRAGRGTATLGAVVAVYALTGLLDMFTFRSYMRVAGTTGEKVLLDLRRRVFDQFQRLSISFYERYTSGRIIARLTSDIDALSELLGSGLVIVSTALLQMIGIIVLLVVLNWRLALVCLAVLPFALLLTVWFRRNSEKAYRASRTAIALVIVHFTESLGGIRAVHAYRREARNSEIFADVNGRYRDANLRATKLIATYGPGVSVLGDLASVGILVIGGWRVLHGELTLGLLAAFIMYMRYFFAPMMDLSQFYSTFQSAASALEKLSGVLEEQTAVPMAAARAPRDPRSGRIVFDRVTFAYRERAVVENLSFEVPSGQTVALVGATGAGKSTIARLVARFYDPGAGSVSIGGVDLRDLDAAQLRAAVAMVTQEGFLFSGTVAENIAFGRPDSDAERVAAAARAVGADEFITGLPDGYQTDVRKRGGRLSAGQRQLVALARVFLADPLVLIFDEATSSVDLVSERRIQEALRVVLSDRTALIIAHRLSTVEIADRVLVLDEGRVVEDGSPSELRASPTRWAALHQAWLDSLA